MDHFHGSNRHLWSDMMEVEFRQSHPELYKQYVTTHGKRTFDVHGIPYHPKEAIERIVQHFVLKFHLIFLGPYLFFSQSVHGK